MTLDVLLENRLFAGRTIFEILAEMGRCFFVKTPKAL